MKHTLIISALTGVLSLSTGYALAAGQESSSTQDTVYGSQMMTQQERAEYRSKLNAAKTATQKEQIRNEHHQSMQERAKSQGLSLPDSPSMQKNNMRQGNGMGSGNDMKGMGSGHGMKGMGSGNGMDDMGADGNMKSGGDMESDSDMESGSGMESDSNKGYGRGMGTGKRMPSGEDMESEDR